MIKNPALKWVVILATGAITYGCSYGAGQAPDWAQIYGGVSTLIVLLCGKLTGFPKQEA